MKTSADILIIGAGLTGVCAGRTLSAAGFDVLIVEASSRIGGRTHSKKIENRIEEQGAEYLHPDHHLRAMKALADHHLNICPETPGSDETWLVSASHQRSASNLEPALIELSRKIDRGRTTDRPRSLDHGKKRAPRSTFSGLRRSIGRRSWGSRSFDGVDRDPHRRRSKIL
ncbi:MAG: NAD(P)-binding protein [Candidatus Azotimanducaceae bacterium]